MLLWKREKQCKNCIHEGGCNVVVGGCEDGSLIYEYEFSCTKGNKTDCDIECLEFCEDLE